MPHSKVQTNDKGARAEFKGQLRNKIDGALAPVPERDPVVLLLPHNHESLSERELLFTLTNNPELQHSQESAVLTVNLLCGRAARPAGTTFQLVELATPVGIPDIVSQAPMERKPGSSVAPGFARILDSSPSRVAAEDLKRTQFKQSLADKIHLTLTAPPAPVKEPKKVRPLVHVVDSPPVERPVRPLKAEALRSKDVTTDAADGEQVWLLPANYRELPESTLGFVLSHDPEFKYTPEDTAKAMSILFGRQAPPADLRFEIIPEATQAVEPQVEPDVEAEIRVFTLPANFRDFSATELHAILRETHSESESLHAMQVLNGLVDLNTVLHISDVVRPVPQKPAGSKRPVPVTQPEKVELRAKNVLGGNPSAPNVLLLPPNYLEMSEAELYSILKYNQEYKHGTQTVARTLDIVFGRQAPPADLRFEIIPEATVEAPAPTSSPELEEIRVFTLPANFRDFSATELHAILRETHSESESLHAMQVLNGLVDTNVVLEISDVVRPVPETSVPKKPSKKPVPFVEMRAKNVLGGNPSAPNVLLLPPNYLEMSEAELYSILKYNQEYKHDPDTLSSTLDVIYGRHLQSATVRFDIFEPPTPQAEQPVADESKEEVEMKVFTLPANFRDFSAAELHSILRETHSESESLHAMQVLNGLVDLNTVLHISDVVRPVPQKRSKRTVRAAPEKVQARAKNVLGGNPSAPQVLLLPSNYLDMSEAELYNTLKFNPDLRHSPQTLDLTLDVVYGRKAQPATVRFVAATV